jgi:hypothetical protein
LHCMAWHGIFVHDGNEYRKHSPSHTRGALPHPGPNHSKRGGRERERFPSCGVIMACPVTNMLAPHDRAVDVVCRGKSLLGFGPQVEFRGLQHYFAITRF